MDEDHPTSQFPPFLLIIAFLKLVRSDPVPAPKLFIEQKDASQVCTLHIFISHCTFDCTNFIAHYTCSLHIVHFHCTLHIVHFHCTLHKFHWYLSWKWSGWYSCPVDWGRLCDWFILWTPQDEPITKSPSLPTKVHTTREAVQEGVVMSERDTWNRMEVIIRWNTNMYLFLLYSNCCLNCIAMVDNSTFNPSEVDSSVCNFWRCYRI